MDFITHLTTLWNKFNKPFHNALVGLAILYFSPKNYQWLGYIFLAIAIASFIEWVIRKIKDRYNAYKQVAQLKNILLRLSNSEKEIVEPLIVTRTQTIHTSEIKNSKLSTYLTLREKGVFEKSNNTSCYSLTSLAFEELSKINKKNPKFFNIKLFIGGTEEIEVIMNRRPK